MDYYTAATLMTKFALAHGEDPSAVIAPIPFFEDLFPSAADHLPHVPHGLLRLELELVHELGGLGGKPLRHLVVAPMGLNVLLDLVESALVRGRDRGNIVPDEATSRQREGVAIDIDVCRERRADDVGAARQIVHGLAARITA